MTYVLNDWKLSKDNWNNELFVKDEENKKIIAETKNIVKKNMENDDDAIINNIKLDQLGDIEKIINKTDFINMKDIDILSQIVITSSWLTENYDITTENCNQFLKILKWQISAIQYFVTMMKLPIPNDKSYTSLIRSSYKLCNQRSDCKYHYPDDIKDRKTCNNQHYPYIQLYVDCMSVMHYIESFFTKKTNDTKANKLVAAIVQQQKEFDSVDLSRCLRTINYVINAVYRELENIIKYRSFEENFNIKDFHCCNEKKKYNNSNNSHNHNHNHNNNQKNYNQ